MHVRSLIGSASLTVVAFIASFSALRNQTPQIKRKTIAIWPTNTCVAVTWVSMRGVSDGRKGVATARGIGGVSPRRVTTAQSGGKSAGHGA